MSDALPSPSLGELPEELSGTHTVEGVLPDGWMCRNLLVRDAKGVCRVLRILRTEWCARTSRTGRTGALLDAWQAAAERRHPRIVPTGRVGRVGFGRMVGAWQLVDCAPGQALGSLVEQETFTPTEAAALLLQLVDVLESCASLGPHLGLCPNNVFVDTTHGPAVYVSDFGTLGPLARHVATLALETPSRGAWLAPEQLCGRHHGAQTDMWQIGALLRYAVTGANPAESTAHEPVHANTRELIRWLMHPDPRSRPGSFAAVRDQLDAIASETAFDALSSLITLNITQEEFEDLEPRLERYAQVVLVGALAFLAGALATWFNP
jgi:serine/threonine protein kinase